MNILTALQGKPEKSWLNSWVLMFPAMLASALAVYYLGEIFFVLLLFIIIIQHKLIRFLPIIITVALLCYFIVYGVEAIWFLFLVNTVLCFLYAIIKVLKQKPINIFSPWFFIPGLYWLFLCVGPMVLKLSDLQTIGSFEHSTLLTLFFVYIFGIIIYYLSLWIGIHSSRPGQHSGNNDEIDTFKFRSIFPYYLFIHFILMVYFFYKVGNLPIFMPDIYQARIEVINQVTGYAYNIIKMISNFACLYLFYYFSNTDDKSIKSKSIILFAYSFLILLSLGWRSDPLIMLIFLIAGYHLFIKQLSLYRVAFLGLMIFIGIVLADFFRMENSGEGILSLLNILYSTLFVDSLNFALILKNVPKYYPFQNGKLLLSGISLLLPGNDLVLGETLRNAFEMGESGGGMTSTIFGEWYVNFGIPGMFAGIFILGAIVGKCYKWSIRNNDFFSKFIYIIVLYKAFVCLRAGLLTSMYSWFVIIFFFMLRKWCLARSDN